MDEELPDINIPSEELPEIDITSEELPEIDITSEELPDINIPSEELPEIDLSGEEIQELDFGINQEQEIDPFLEYDPNAWEKELDNIKEEEEHQRNLVADVANVSAQVFGKALNAMAIPYNMSMAAASAYKHGFSAPEIVNYATQQAYGVDGEKLAELKDLIYFTAIQNGASATEAFEQSDRSLAADAAQFTLESTLDLSNAILPATPIIKSMVDKPVKGVVKWLARRPTAVVESIPKLATNAMLSMPEDMFKRYVNRFDKVEEHRRFFTPSTYGDTEFDEYANRLTDVISDLRDNNIKILNQAPDLLKTGANARDILSIFRNEIDSMRVVQGDAEKTSLAWLKQQEQDFIDNATADFLNIPMHQLTADTPRYIDVTVRPKTLRQIMKQIQKAGNWSDTLVKNTEKEAAANRVSGQINNLLKNLPGNEDYKELMERQANITSKLSDVYENLGIKNFKTKQEIVDGEVLEVMEEMPSLNGKKFRDYSRRILNENRSRSMQDVKIRTGLSRVEELLKGTPGYSEDYFFTNDDVLKDLAVNDMLHDSTYQGSRKVNAMSFLAGGVAELASLPYRVFQGIGTAAGLLSDTHGREMGKWFIQNFLKEDLKKQKYFIKPIVKLNKAADKVFIEGGSWFLPGIVNSMTKEYIDKEQGNFDAKTGVFKVYGEEAYKSLIEQAKANKELTTKQKMDLITAWTRQMRMNGEIPLMISPSNEQAKDANKRIKAFSNGEEIDTELNEDSFRKITLPNQINGEN